MDVVRAYPGLAKAAGDNISTDIKTRDLDAWVELGQKIKSAEVRSLPFTNEGISYGSPNYREIKSLVRTAIRKPSPETAATPAPDPSVVTPTPGATGKPKPGKSQPPKQDPTKAQNVKDVC